MSEYPNLENYKREYTEEDAKRLNKSVEELNESVSHHPVWVSEWIEAFKNL